MDATEEMPEGLKEIEDIEDIITIKDFFGKYTWNNGAWDESESADKAVLEFPVGSATGRIEATGVSSEYSIEEEGVNVQFPKQLTVKIFYNNAQCGSIEANGDALTANDEFGVPATASLTITIDGYTIAQTFTKGDATAKLTLKNGDNTLVAATAKLDGNIDSIVDNDRYIPEGTNFSMTLMDNLMLVGKVDIASMNKEMDALDNADEESYDKGYVEAFNKHVEIYLASTKDKTKIAKLLLKLVDNGDGEYNADFYLKFNDETEVEAVVYFTEGFDAVIENFEDFMELMEIDYFSDDFLADKIEYTPINPIN
jgi:hypothetical protein